MRIGPATLRTLLALAGAGAQGWPLLLVCGVEGGLACRWASGGWDDGLSALAKLVVADIGWKAIEHAAGREVVISCAGPGACQIDFGDGFVDLPSDAAGWGETDA
jgi:hypothetical protein